MSLNTHSACIPRHYAAASLKQIYDTPDIGVFSGIPRHYAAASLKPVFQNYLQPQALYSAALRRGLIEACSFYSFFWRKSEYSAALRRGLIEADKPPNTY